MPAHPISTNARRHRECPHGLLPEVAGFLHALLPAHPLPAARQGLDQSPFRREHHTRSLVIHDNGDSEAPVLSQHPQKLADFGTDHAV